MIEQGMLGLLANAVNQHRDLSRQAAVTFVRSRPAQRLHTYLVEQDGGQFNGAGFGEIDDAHDSTHQIGVFLVS